MIKIFLLFAAWIIGVYLWHFNRLVFYHAIKPYTPQEPKPKKPKMSFRHLMARVKYAGTGAVSLSGKIGGTVFTNGGVFGPFVRVWRKPRRIRNAATTLVRGVLSGISSSYKTLTPAQIATWVAAKPDFIRKNVFGEIKHLTPNLIYQRVNNILVSLGLAAIPDAPAVGSTDSVTAMAGAASVGGGTFTITPVLFSGGIVLPANTYAKVYATRQVNDSKQSFGKSDYRYIGFFAPAQAIPIPVFADYTAKFGGLVLGKNISICTELVSYFSGTPGVFAKTGLTYATVVVAA